MCAYICAQLCPTLCNPVESSQPGSSVHEIFQAKNTGVGCHVLLKGIFLIQGSNPCLLRCQEDSLSLYHLFLNQQENNSFLILNPMGCRSWSLFSKTIVLASYTFSGHWFSVFLRQHAYLHISHSPHTANLPTNWWSSIKVSFFHLCTNMLFFDDPANVGNLISGASAFSKLSFVHLLVFGSCTA